MTTNGLAATACPPPERNGHHSNGTLDPAPEPEMSEVAPAALTTGATTASAASTSAATASATDHTHHPLFNSRSPVPTRVDDIKLYDITPMDYFSKTQRPLSKTQVFRDELWRRRYRQQNTSDAAGGSPPGSSLAGAQRRRSHRNGGSGESGGSPPGAGAGGSGSSNGSSTDSMNIETVLTRNMSQGDLRGLLEHQMVEALKLTRMWSCRDDDSNDEAAQLEMDACDMLVSQSCATLVVSTKRRRSRKSLKAENTRRVSL